MLAYLKNKIWPIRDTVRILAGQFQSEKGMRMVLHRRIPRLNFIPTTAQEATTLLLGFPVTDLTITMSAGKAEIVLASGARMALNRREQELLALAANVWLESITPSQMEVLE